MGAPSFVRSLHEGWEGTTHYSPPCHHKIDSPWRTCWRSLCLTADCRPLFRCLHGAGSGHLPGVLDSMDDCDGGEHGQNPEYRSHDSPAIEQGSEDDEHHSLRALHEAD